MFSVDWLLFEGMFSQLDGPPCFLRALDWTECSGRGQASISRGTWPGTLSSRGMEPHLSCALRITFLVSMGPLPEVSPGLGEAELCSQQVVVTAERNVGDA